MTDLNNRNMDLNKIYTSNACSSSNRYYIYVVSDMDMSISEPFPSLEVFIWD